MFPSTQFQWSWFNTPKNVDKYPNLLNFIYNGTMVVSKKKILIYAKIFVKNLNLIFKTANIIVFVI